MTEPAAAPSRRATVVNTAISVAVAAGLCVYAARGLSAAAVREGMGALSLPVLAGALVVFTATYYAMEILGFGMTWRRHVWDQMPWSHVRALVCGKQILFLVFPLLTKTVGPLYFWRRRRISPLLAVGASEMIGGAELTVAAAASLAGAVQVSFALAAALGAALAIAVALVLLRRAPAIAGLRFFRALREASAGELWFQLALRAAIQAIALACVWLLLAGMGARLDLGQLLTFGPIFVISGSSIVSIAGYGGPQGVAVEVLANRWGALSAPAALGFSLAWSTGLLVTQTLVGAFHFPRMVQLLRAHGDG
ncbi:MAG TPA: hypothetical protein VFB81_11145 [Myxococcales bacterium]|nr:hypothetical protein [Myxococcales bacterium]